MDNIAKTELKVLTTVGMALLVLFFGITEYKDRSKFKVGDCVEQVYDFEFERTVYYHHIVAVGNEMYLTNQKSDKSNYFFSLNNQEWKSKLNKYDQVDVSNCILK
jgi:hypothetical protein